MGFREDAIEILKSMKLPPDEYKEGMAIVEEAIKSEEGGEKTEKSFELTSLDELYKGRGPDKQKRKSKGGSFHDVAYGHQLAIAKKTLKMTPEMANIMGGMSLDEAKSFMARHNKRG